MRSKNLVPLKHLGQNFLKDANIARKIVNCLGNIKDRTVYEIGPGMGALTTHLISSGANVTCFEIDKRAVEFLKAHLNQANLRCTPQASIEQTRLEMQTYMEGATALVVNADIRDIKIPQECHIAQNASSVESEINAPKAYLKNQGLALVVGNIPYNITNDIVFWLLDNSAAIDTAVLTIQYEVAQRYTAPINTKSYGITTLALQLYCKPKICFNIPGTAFFPAPKVRSSVILMDFSDKTLYKYVDKQGVIALIRAAFSQRRKILSNSLNNYLVSSKLNAEILQEKLIADDKKYLAMRAEQLSLDDYIDLYKYFIEY